MPPRGKRTKTVDRTIADRRRRRNKAVQERKKRLHRPGVGTIIKTVDRILSDRRRRRQKERQKRHQNPFRKRFHT